MGGLIAHMAAADHKYLARFLAAVLVRGGPTVMICHRDCVGLGFRHVEDRNAVAFERVVKARLIHAHRPAALSAIDQFAEHLVQLRYRYCRHRIPRAFAAQLVNRSDRLPAAAHCRRYWCGRVELGGIRTPHLSHTHPAPLIVTS